jgi:GMP synthase (glutamine-hydrolysing)
MHPASGSPKPTVLLLDLYEWSDAYPATNPLRNVGGWFAKHLPVGDTIELATAGVKDDMLAAAQGVQGVIISGSPRDAWVDDPINDRVISVIEHCRATGTPLLGVCYGHQILGKVLKANVGRHPGGYELGNVEVELTEAGAACPLFEGLPRKLSVMESHQDAVLEVPPGARLLASGSHTAVQAFAFGDNLLAIQFHPEMSPEVLQFVWGEPRRALWRPKLPFDLDERLAGLRPNPEATRIFGNFIKHYVL